MHKKKTIKEIKRMPLIFPIELQSFSEGDLTKEIQVLPVGKWNHPAYGPITITREDIAQFKENFDKGIRKDIPITEGHETFGEKPAVGWFVELIDRGGNGLYATVEWNKEGKTLLSEKSYKYFSPEFYSEYEDPESREIYENVLVGGALTNKPYFKELDAVVLSENIINNKLKFNDMDIKEILEKKVEDLSTEEKTFLKENKDQLNDEQLATFGSVFEEGDDGSGDEGDGNGDGAGDGQNGNGDGDNGDGSGDGNGDGGDGSNGDGNGDGDGKTQASEFKMDGKGNVIMSMAEVKALEAKANAGFEASEKLRRSEIRNMSDKLILTEQNSEGKILPKHEEKVFTFMLGLSEAQRKTFAEIVESIPSKQLFEEKGSGQPVEGTAFIEINAKVEEEMKKDSALKYSDALKKVCSENKELADRYENEK